MNPEPTIRVNVDVTNPGQFFACCGLLELANRLWPGAEGWFEEGAFCVTCAGTLREILSAAQQLSYSGEAAGIADSEDDSDESDSEDTDDSTTITPIEITSPFSILLDWWKDKDFKPWAGSMNERVIFRMMTNAIDPTDTNPLDQEIVVRDPSKVTVSKKGVEKVVLGKPREPFYFDSRRGTNAVDRDVGFVLDSLKKAYKVTTTAFPVVESLTMIGLQRCRPYATDKPRVFVYFTWSWPCEIHIVPVAVIGVLGDPLARGYRFQNAFRTGQRKHKAFNSATPIGDSDE